jgi:transcriptional regulator with XRE-family HTH domain
VSLGVTIRERRLAANLTLVALAERAGLSQPFLSQVENGRAAPSVESLYRIATALGTTPQGLFGHAGAAHRPAVARSDGDVPSIDTAGESLRRLLLPGDSPFHVVELVGLATEFRESWHHEGVEALYVLQGPVEVEVGDAITELGTGDFMSYPAHLPHRYRSSSGASARALLVETDLPAHGGPVVHLEAWTGPWHDDDKDANLKADVALYAKVDPLRTVRGLSASTDIPTGAIVRWVLARWASEGSSGLLELGPTMTRRLQAVCTDAEDADTDEARLLAYHQLRQMISWLNHPLDHPEVHDLD